MNLKSIAALALASLVSAGAHAQTFPSKPIRILLSAKFNTDQPFVADA